MSVAVVCKLAWRAYAMFSLAALTAGCGEDTSRLEFENPDLTQFQQTAYPILLRDCGFPACHGDTQRFFRVFGPGRTRLVPTMKADEPVTADEIRASYARAVSMLVNDESILDSWLLRKPLDVEAGGSSHVGADAWGRNVYASVADPAYVALLKWAYSRPPVQGPTP